MQTRQTPTPLSALVHSQVRFVGIDRDNKSGRFKMEEEPKPLPTYELNVEPVEFYE